MKSLLYIVHINIYTFTGIFLKHDLLQFQTFKCVFHALYIKVKGFTLSIKMDLSNSAGFDTDSS